MTFYVSFYRLDMFLAHPASQLGTTTPTIASGVRALPWRDFLTKAL